MSVSAGPMSPWGTKRMEANDGIPRRVADEVDDKN